MKFKPEKLPARERLVHFSTNWAVKASGSWSLRVHNILIEGEEYIEDITRWREDMNFMF